MDSKTVHLTGRELYDLVWTHPVTKVAARFHLSDVGLKKVCARHRIPVPPRGYWQRLAAGHRVKRTALPLPVASRSITITVCPKDAPVETPIAEHIVALMDHERLPQNRIAVPDMLLQPHPITVAIRRDLMARNPDRYGARSCCSADTFRVRVTGGSIDRALRIIDALVKACLHRGFTLRPGSTPHQRSPWPTTIVVNGEPLNISLEERLQRRPHQPPEGKRGRYDLMLAPRYDFLPTGELTLKIETPYGSGLRSAWVDSKKRRIEQCLNEVMVGLLQAGDRKRIKRLEDEEHERRRQAEARRREELQRRIAEERAAVARLEKDAVDWRRAELIRAYVNAVEAEQTARGEPMGEWIAWARAQADRLDPLRPSPSSVLDEDRRSPSAMGVSSVEPVPPPIGW